MCYHYNYNIKVQKLHTFFLINYNIKIQSKITIKKTVVHSCMACYIYKYVNWL